MATLKESVYEQYNRFEQLVEEYFNFSSKAGYKRFSHPLKNFKNMFWAAMVIFSRSSVVTESEKVSVMRAKFFESVHSDEEKKTPFFKIFTAKIPLDALVIFLKKECKGYDPRKLLKFHSQAVRGVRKIAAPFLKAIGISLSVASFLLSIVPRDFITQIINWNYNDYLIVVMYVIGATIFYLGFILGTYYLVTRRTTRVMWFVERVLEYMEICEF